MAKLSVSQAWEEGSRFAAREFGLLYPIALLLLELPALLVFLVAPPPGIEEPRNLAEFIDQFGGAPFFILFTILSLLAVVIQTFGSLAITWLALRPGTSVRESLGAAARRLPAVLGAIILLGIGVGLLLLPLVLLADGMSPGPSPATGAGGLLVLLVAVVLCAAIFTRLVLATPVGVAERLGPIGILNRSWALTRGHFWPIFGALLMISIVLVIILFLIGLVFAMIVLVLVGDPQVDRTAAFVLELLNSLVIAIVTIFMLSFIARLYTQLAGSSAPAIPA